MPPAFGSVKTRRRGFLSCWRSSMPGEEVRPNKLCATKWLHIMQARVLCNLEVAYMTNAENSIEREIEIKAPVAKVWEALTDSKLFGQWFKANCQSPFVAGRTTKAMNTSKGFEFKMEFMIKEIRPQTYFSYAWHPFPVDRSFDYSKEEPTLVEFNIEKTATGTLVKVKESGFNKITASRRAEAFRMHTGGWEAQLRNIEAFLVEKK